MRTHTNRLVARTWTRVRFAAGGVCATAAVALAAPPAVPLPVDGPPTTLPPLLPVAKPDRATCDDCPPAGPVAEPPVEYDRSLLYLPDKAPQPVAAADGDRHHRFRDQPPPVDAPPERGWFTPAALLGWSSDGPAPSGMAGDGPLDNDFRVGLTLDAGLWLEPSRDWALTGDMLYLSQGAGNRSGSGVVGGPSTVATADWTTRFLSAGLGVRRELYRGPAGDRGAVSLAGTAGYRFGFVGEDLAISSTRSRPVRAEVGNQFHGGEVGLAGGWRAGAWWADVTGRVGLGASVPDVTLAGANVPAATDPGFAVFPVLTASLGRQISEHSRAFVGYTFQYLNRATRPGAALDGDGPVDFWVQGVNVGWRWEY